MKMMIDVDRMYIAMMRKNELEMHRMIDTNQT